MITNQTVFLICTLILSVECTYILLWIVLKSPLVNVCRDRPGFRKVHQRVIPRLGGLCLVPSFLMFMCIWHYVIPSTVPKLSDTFFDVLVFTAICTFAIGFFDDTIQFTINNRAKLLLEILIAVEVVVFLKYYLYDISLFGHTIVLGHFGAIFTVIWIVGIANAINMIDGLDGLAGLIVLVTLIALGFLAQKANAYELVILSLLLLGLVIGFLHHNISPARVFLGDTGSLFLGMTLGILSIQIISIKPIHYPVYLAPLLIAFPIIDISVAMGRRFIKSIISGKSIVRSLIAMTIADNEHIHHRLVFRGLSHSQACIILSFLAAFFCITGMVIAFLPFTSIFLLLYSGFVLAWFLYRLNFFDRFVIFYRTKRDEKLSHINPRGVCVINADAITCHALKKYPQDNVKFTFVEIQELNFVKNWQFDAIVVYNGSDELLIPELETVYKTTNSYKCPVVVITDAEVKFLKKELPMLDDQLLFIRKPIYVPGLVRELHQLTKNNDTRVQERVLRETTHIRTLTI